MGRELLGKYPVFKSSLLDAGAYLRTLGCHWHLIGKSRNIFLMYSLGPLIGGLDELQKGKSESNVNNPAYSQPLCSALQVALVDLLESFGIVPAAVVGHSSGEIAAAYVDAQSLPYSV
jgi:malonyl CoA-acyl carrier protein transacylase